MGELWIPEAEDLKAVGTSGVMDGGTPRATLHVTVSRPGSFDAMDGVLTRAQAEPHLLYDPATDRLGQYFALDRSARALRNDGTRRTNGHGSVNIQIEVCAMPDGFTSYWKPGPNWAALLRAVRSWGVPDVWPAGRLSATGSDGVDRSWASYSKAGWFGHCNVPGNDHWDPGPISQAAIFTTSEEDDMPTAAEIATEVLTRPVYDLAGNKLTVGEAIGITLRNSASAATDAKVARALAEAAAKAPKPLTAAEVDDIAAATVAALDDDYNATVTLTPKDA